MTRVLIAVAAVVAAGALFLVFRPDDDEGGSAAGGATTTTQTTTTTTTAGPPPPPPRPQPPPARVRIVVRDGQPVDGVRRVTVSEGRGVVLIVTSNVADHVHLHGYDIMRDVGPGQPARIAFRATIVGTVEAELEDRRVPLARIVTQP